MAQRRFVWSGIGLLVLLGLTLGGRALGGRYFSPHGRTSSASTPFSSSSEAERCPQDEFAWVPDGTFIYGSDRAERDYGYQISALAIAQRNASESGDAGTGNPTADDIARAEAGLRRNRWFEREPERQERSLPGFCLQRHLVTNADYRQFVQATGHRAPFISAVDYQAQGFLVHPYEEVSKYLWIEQDYPMGKSDHPVVLVSYDDALAYATWKGEQDGQVYRLPTAEEWEKAARGEDGRYFPWGNQWRDDGTNWAGTAAQGRSADVDAVEPFPGESNPEFRRLEEPGTSAIAQFPLSQSPYGIDDMAGNVFEYTSTLHRRPQGLRAVMKGCSWDDWPGFCRTAYEHSRPVESRHILFGFRLVKVASSGDR